MADYINPTPRNGLLGLLADGVQSVNDFAAAPFGHPNPPVNLLMRALGVSGLVS